MQFATSPEASTPYLRGSCASCCHVRWNDPVASDPEGAREVFTHDQVHWRVIEPIGPNFYQIIVRPDLEHLNDRRHLCLFRRCRHIFRDGFFLHPRERRLGRHREYLSNGGGQRAGATLILNVELGYTRRLLSWYRRVALAKSRTTWLSVRASEWRSLPFAGSTILEATAEGLRSDRLRGDNSNPHCCALLITKTNCALPVCQKSHLGSSSGVRKITPPEFM